MDEGRTDLMFQDEIRAAVAASYQALPHGAGRAIVRRLYEPAAVVELPQTAVSWALGVGDPVRHADLQPGEAVLDLGCGGGIDSVLAARRVGPGGWVLGVDVLPEMCARAQLAAEAAGVADRCRFVPGAGTVAGARLGQPRHPPRRDRP